MTKFSAFLKDEAGAVTVDWVVLTAAFEAEPAPGLLATLVIGLLRP